MQEDENENTRRSSRDLITSRTGQDRTGQDCLESVQVQDFNSPPHHPVGRSNYPDPDRLSSQSCIAPVQYKFTFVNRNVVIIHCFAQACSLVIDSLGLTVQVVVASCTQ